LIILFVCRSLGAFENLSEILSGSEIVSSDDLTFPISIRIRPIGFRITKEIGASKYRYVGISGLV
jgi:hypothetical protein